MMKGLLVDSNVILDILTNDKEWFHWSSETLEKYAEKTTLHINNIIYAEISIAFDSIEDLEMAVPDHFFKRAVTTVGREKEVAAAGLRAFGVGRKRAADEIDLLIHGSQCTGASPH
jgi:hypothetical protein